jgi:hypothetical protein
MQPFHDRSVVITFCSREAQPTLERSGFGEGFLFNYGIDAIHIVCSDNSWYQYDDIYAALDAAVGHLESYANKVAMGWSMGGYAAVNFSEYLGVDRVIAVSPQFSADPTKVPLETRWRRDRRRINFRHDLIHTLTRGRRQFCSVFDDRHALDRHHVERIKAYQGVGGHCRTAVAAFGASGRLPPRVARDPGNDDHPIDRGNLQPGRIYRSVANADCRRLQSLPAAGAADRPVGVQTAGRSLGHIYNEAVRQ